MTLEIKSTIFIQNQEPHSKFSTDQLEILEDEYAKKLANEEIKNLENLETVSQFRKKYHVSKRDAFDLIARNYHEY